MFGKERRKFDVVFQDFLHLCHEYCTNSLKMYRESPKIFEDQTIDDDEFVFEFMPLLVIIYLDPCAHLFGNEIYQRFWRKTVLYIEESSTPDIAEEFEQKMEFFDDVIKMSLNGQFPSHLAPTLYHPLVTQFLINIGVVDRENINFTTANDYIRFSNNLIGTSMLVNFISHGVHFFPILHRKCKIVL